jgi:hypothetical protein
MAVLEEYFYIIVYVGGLLLAVIGIPVGVACLLYFVPKKLGYPNVAKYLTRIYGVLVLAVILSAVFEDQLFNKNDAKELVEEQNIQLRDKFVISSNVSSTGSGGYHRFTLEISEYDKQEAIRTIRSSNDFKTNEKMINRLPYLGKSKYFGPKIIWNYETKDAYVREYLQPAESEGYSSTFRRISISKTGKQLIFEDIDV